MTDLRSNGYHSNAQPSQKWKNPLLALLSAWFLAALFAAYVGVFGRGSRFSMDVPIPLGLAATVPVAAFAIWFRLSSKFREYVLSLDIAYLTAAHAWRVGGVVFVVLFLRGVLPPTFALLAGLGDMAVGLTAPYMALAWSRGTLSSSRLQHWHILGILDLVVAIATGVLSSNSKIGILTRGSAITSAPMGYLPLSLIPTFAVPLLVILHMIAFSELRSLKAAGKTASDYHDAVQAVVRG
ncbi:MAG: hypothetical protein ACYCSN_06810 [Acidobacteriaceae bacterium]